MVSSFSTPEFSPGYHSEAEKGVCSGLDIAIEQQILHESAKRFESF